jgi:hypothetical protein
MDKETLFTNVKIIKNKNLELWTKDDIDNLLILYKYKDCYQYYDIVLKLLKKYIDWRKINNISYNYSLINLINVYLLITESLIINNYVNYYEIYDILHTKSLCDIFWGLSSDTLLMCIVILFMIFRICYYIKILTKSSLIKSSITNHNNNNNDLIYDNNFLKFPDNFINQCNSNNIPNFDVFGLNLNINEDLQENKEINNNKKFDIKNIFKNIDLGQNFNLEKFDFSSIMKNFEDNIKSNNDNKNESNNDNLKCTCHLCNNCINKKNI